MQTLSMVQASLQFVYLLNNIIEQYIVLRSQLSSVHILQLFYISYWPNSISAVPKIRNY